MLYTDNIKSYSNISEKINRYYATKHNYDFIVEHNRLATDRAPQWDKVKMIKKYLPNYEYIFWIDSDAIFVNYSKKLEYFINKAPKHNLLICDDTPNGGYINTGTMFFKNNDWSKKFLKEWWDIGTKSEYNYKFAHEQTILKNLLQENKYNKYNAKDNTKIFNTNDFNTEYNMIVNKYNYNNNLFILHLMQTKEEKRINIFNNYLKKIK